MPMSGTINEGQNKEEQKIAMSDKKQILKISKKVPPEEKIDPQLLKNFPEGLSSQI